MPTACRGYAAFKTVGLTRRGWPIYRHRRELLRPGESAKGRVQPPGEPVNVWRTRETKGDVSAFLGLRVLISFACALGESALPFAGSATTVGQPHLFHRQPTTDLLPLPFKNQNSSIDNSCPITPLATSRRGTAAQPYLPFASFGVIRGSTFSSCRWKEIFNHNGSGG